MLTKLIVVAQGRPDLNNDHYCHAVTSAYAEGAINNSHLIQKVDVADLALPFFFKVAKKLSQEKSAYIIVSIGMPAWFYRIYYRGDSIKSLQRGII